MFNVLDNIEDEIATRGLPVLERETPVLMLVGVIRGRLSNDTDNISNVNIAKFVVRHKDIWFMNPVLNEKGFYGPKTESVITLPHKGSFVKIKNTSGKRIILRVRKDRKLKSVNIVRPFSQKWVKKAEKKYHNYKWYVDKIKSITLRNGQSHKELLKYSVVTIRDFGDRVESKLRQRKVISIGD